MIDQIHNIITDSIKSNQFLSGGLVLGVIGGIAVYLRQIPSKLMNFMIRKIIVDIEIRNTEECYKWLIRWFHSQKFTNKSNKLILSSWEDYYTENDNNNESKRHIFCLSPGIGIHFFVYKKKFFWIHRERRDGSVGNEGILRDIETINISTFRWNKSLVFDMAEESKNAYFGRQKDGVLLYTPDFDSWCNTSMISKRKIESVILNDGTMDALINDISCFFASKEKYYDLGIPYHRGYMFSGSPGNGKTATILALASHFNRPIYYMNISSITSDYNLQSLFGNVSKNAFVIIEDIDTTNSAYRRNGENKDSSSFKVTFGQLLNSLDGIGAKEGMCVFITTNHPERLDPALIRNGRIDMHIKFGCADSYMARRMIKRFFPNANCDIVDEIAEEIGLMGDVSMASLQETLNCSKTIFDVHAKIFIKQYERAVI